MKILCVKEYTDYYIYIVDRDEKMIKLFIEYNKETLDKMYHDGNASDDELVCDIMVNDFIKNYKDEYVDAYFYDFHRFEEVQFEQITHKYQTYEDIFYLPDVTFKYSDTLDYKDRVHWMLEDMNKK